MAFDEFEPIGSRVTPDLLSLLVTITANIYRKEGTRAFVPQDILPDPMSPRRLSEVEEEARTRNLAAEYRRLRAERMAKMDQDQMQQEDQ